MSNRQRRQGQALGTEKDSDGTELFLEEDLLLPKLARGRRSKTPLIIDVGFPIWVTIGTEK